MKKGITFELDKPRTLRFGINALAKIEDLTGKPLTTLKLDSVGIKDLLIITYAGLAHEDQDLTVEKVGDLIDEYSSIEILSQKLGEALTLAFGKEETKGN